MKLRQFSLSTLVIAVLVCSVLIWLGSNFIRGVLRSRKLSADAQLVHSVKKSVGGGGFSLVRVHGGSEVYDEYGFNLHSVTDQSIARLRQLNHLHVEHLNIENRPISDRGLQSIAQFDHLRSLDLSGTNITSASLGLIGQLKSLEKVDLSDTDISDSNLSALGESDSLKTIYVGRTNISDNGLDLIRTHCPNVVIKCDVEMSGWGRENADTARGSGDS